jgi:hypothetical protein
VREANFIVVEQTYAHILIRDIGPWDKYPTVTNDAENVVKYLADVLGSRKLYYFDSEGELGELMVKNGRFAGFAPCQAIPKGQQ